jgi:sporulation protein YlmC with PRC-barrel domain
MDVVRDVLDKIVVDRNGREMGRVDGILVEQGEGQPRITTLLIGPSVLGSRLHPALGRWVTTIERYLGVNRDQPCRIGVDVVERVDSKVELRLTIGETTAAAVEQLLRKWIIKLPGSQ